MTTTTPTLPSSPSGAPSGPPSGTSGPGPGPTLLVFTRGARGDCRRRPLLPRAWRAAELDLRGACLEAALDAGRRAGCALRVASPEPLALAPDVAAARQHGAGFGERLERAMAAAGASPAAPLLVVGTDVPGLDHRPLSAALAALADDPDCVVLGPSPDGGFYLLATARPLPGLAGLTRWCRRDTLAGLRRSLAARGRRVVLLEPLADLDRRADLERWLARAPRPRAEPRALGRDALHRAALHRVTRAGDALDRAVAAVAAALSILRRPLAAATVAPPRLVPVRRAVPRGPPA